MSDERNNIQSEKPEQNLNELLAIRRQKLADLQSEGMDPFAITKYEVTHHSTDVKNNYEILEGKEVSIAGRLMSKRVMGKAYSVTFRTSPARFSATSHATVSALTNMQDSKSTISAISSA